MTMKLSGLEVTERRSVVKGFGTTLTEMNILKRTRLGKPRYLKMIEFNITKPPPPKLGDPLLIKSSKKTHPYFVQNIHPLTLTNLEVEVTTKSPFPEVEESAEGSGWRV